MGSHDIERFHDTDSSKIVLTREDDPRTLAAMAWTLRHEGCHNVNWVGGEVVIHLHAIVDTITLGRDFTQTQTEFKRALSGP